MAKSRRKRTPKTLLKLLAKHPDYTRNQMVTSVNAWLQHYAWSTPQVEEWLLMSRSDNAGALGALHKSQQRRQR